MKRGYRQGSCSARFGPPHGGLKCAIVFQDSDIREGESQSNLLTSYTNTDVFGIATFHYKSSSCRLRPR